MRPKSKPFKFKQFVVHQSASAMKVGTDSVILGATASAENAKNILDIGCGTAVLSLMLAQKSTAKITAIDIDGKAINEAKRNVELSPWRNNILVLKQSLFDFAQSNQAQFDLIICNPPFYRGKNTNSQRSIARQNSNLPFALLFKETSNLLSANGVFYGIFPFAEKQYLLETIESLPLFLREEILIKGNKNTAVKRIILCIKKIDGKLISNNLIVEKERNVYTETCHQLLKPYLLYL